MRWLSRYVIEGRAPSLLKASIALAALSELRTAGERQAAAKLLAELARVRPA